MKFPAGLDMAWLGALSGFILAAAALMYERISGPRRSGSPRPTARGHNTSLLLWVTGAFGGLALFLIRYARVVHDPGLVLLAPRLILPPPFNWIYAGWALLVRSYTILATIIMPLLWLILLLALVLRGSRRSPRPRR